MTPAETIPAPDECRATILRIDELGRAGIRCVGIGDDMRRAILHYASTQYLSTEPELHEAAKAIVNRVPGEFPLHGARACE